MNGRERKSPDDIRRLLEGPVASIPTPFKEKGDIDWDGVANIIEVAIGGGSGVILLTAGDSQLFFLTEAEIAQLTRFTIDRTAGRALTVAATGLWSTRQAEAFARQSVEWGADLLMSTTEILGADPAGLAAHYCCAVQDHTCYARRISGAPRARHAGRQTGHMLPQRGRPGGVCRPNATEIQPSSEGHDRRLVVAAPS